MMHRRLDHAFGAVLLTTCLLASVPAHAATAMPAKNMILILLHPLSWAAFGASLITGILMTKRGRMKRWAAAAWIVAIQSATIMLACGAYRGYISDCFPDQPALPLDRLALATIVGMLLSFVASRAANGTGSERRMMILGLLGLALVIVVGMRYHIPMTGSPGGTSCLSRFSY